MFKIDHFNILGPFYDLIFGHKKDLTMIELADLKPNQSLLDVGGGTGRVTVLFQEISKNLLIADSARKMLLKAREKGIQTINTQSEYLPFQKCVFDRLIMVDALHHVINQEETLKEMWRILAEGGKIVIEEPDINHFVVKLLAIGEKLLLMRSHFLSPKEISEMALKEEDASVKIRYGNGIAWIVISKKAEIT